MYYYRTLANQWQVYQIGTLTHIGFALNQTEAERITNWLNNCEKAINQSLPPAENQWYTIPLPGRRIAYISLPPDIDEKSINLLMEWVELLRRSVQSKPDTQEEPTS